MKHSIKQELKSIEYLVLATDMWSGCHNRGYMSISAHFVGHDWDMHHYCLQTCEVASSYTALNLGDEISRSTDEWKITSKVVMVTSSIV